MTQAKELLTMLEAVTDATTDELYDEIDARTWCYLNRYELISVQTTGFVCADGKSSGVIVGLMGENLFSRSIDASEAVRVAELEDYRMAPSWRGNASMCSMWKIGKELDADFVYKTPPLHSEPIARLHAIIQAIDWKRENDITSTT